MVIHECDGVMAGIVTEQHRRLLDGEIEIILCEFILELHALVDDLTDVRLDVCGRDESRVSEAQEDIVTPGAIEIEGNRANLTRAERTTGEMVEELEEKRKERERGR